MRTSEFAAALRKMTPQFVTVEGVYLHLRQVDDDERHKTSVTNNKRPLKQFEQDANRLFIVADLLDHVTEERRDWDSADLLTIADAYAAILRDALRQSFPDIPFDVEIIGQALVDDEPLELCVTFSRVR